MNAIITAIHRITTIHINPEILRYGLVDPNTNDHMLSTDELLLQKVIRPIVIGDMDLYGANEITIPISRCTMTYSGPDGFSISVPKSLTNGREIVTVNEVFMGDPTAIYGQSGTCTSSGVITKNLESIDMLITADARLVGTNIVYINKFFPDLTNLMMVCIIDNDKALNNISTRSYNKFTELVLYATQAYIFNQKRMALGTGHIEQGHNIDTYKEIIYEWSDASKQYREFFDNTWRKVSFMNDKVRKKKLVGNMFSNNM